MILTRNSNVFSKRFLSEISYLTFSKTCFQFLIKYIKLSYIADIKLDSQKPLLIFNNLFMKQICVGVCLFGVCSYARVFVFVCVWSDAIK